MAEASGSGGAKSVAEIGYIADRHPAAWSCPGTRANHGGGSPASGVGHSRISLIFQRNIPAAGTGRPRCAYPSSLAESTLC